MLPALLTSFATVLVAELGDKTQLAALLLSSRYGAREVFLGAMLAVCLLDGASILLGGALGELFPSRAVSLLGALLFLGFGIWSLLDRGEGGGGERRAGSVLLSSFLTVSLMELGDKTQISVFALSTRYPLLPVFLGAVLAYLLLMGAGTAAGNRLRSFLEGRELRRVSGVLFLLFGLLFLLTLL
jgi:putative Ca2+/H+ antiporter (TMEM165/GDT1 family)